MDDIIARIDAHLAECASAHCQELEPDSEPILRECRDEIIAARACAEMMLQGTGHRLAESMAERVISGHTVGAWIPVGERLPKIPEFGISVIVLAAHDEYDLTMAGFVPTGKTKTSPANFIGSDSYGPFFRSMVNGRRLHVGHWMPLPEPPEVK